MGTDISLRGMTWSDPRGYDPLVAAAQAYKAQHPDVTISWDKRSLQGFESTPVDELAARYDFIVVDHPHVGAVVAEDCLLPLDSFGDADALLKLEAETVGKSFHSYLYAGHQWALPIDAATQVQAIRPDKIDGPVKHMREVATLARDGVVIWPMRPPHVLMTFFTLMGNLGTPCAVTKGPLCDVKSGLYVLDFVQSIYQHLDPICAEIDPIVALDILAGDNRFTISPLAYLYAPYAGNGYRENTLRYHDIPSLGQNGPLGSALGGTGIAVSARTKHPDVCVDFALWVASAEVQKGLYAANNGQPGNAAAWGDCTVNATRGNAYASTRMTHEAAWLRPRHNGYMGFQEEASHILLEALNGKTSHVSALEALTKRFKESFSHE